MTVATASYQARHMAQGLCLKFPETVIHGKRLCTRHQVLANGTIRRSRAQARLRLLEALGGRCIRCGFADGRALDIDHVDGGGTQVRQRLGGIGNARYMQHLTHALATGAVQLLCANCHRIKDHERLHSDT